MLLFSHLNHHVLHYPILWSVCVCFKLYYANQAYFALAFSHLVSTHQAINRSLFSVLLRIFEQKVSAKPYQIWTPLAMLRKRTESFVFPQYLVTSCCDHTVHGFAKIGQKCSWSLTKRSLLEQQMIKATESDRLRLSKKCWEFEYSFSSNRRWRLLGNAPINSNLFIGNSDLPKYSYNLQFTAPKAKNSGQNTDRSAPSMRK